MRRAAVAHAAEAEYLVPTAHGATPSELPLTFDLPAGFARAAGKGEYQRTVPLSGLAAECRIALLVRGAAVRRAPRRSGRDLLVPSPSDTVHGGRIRIVAAGRHGPVRYYGPAVSGVAVGGTIVDAEPGESTWQGAATLPTPAGTGAPVSARTTVVVAHIRSAAYGIERTPDGGTITLPATPAALASCITLVHAEVPEAVRMVLSSVAAGQRPRSS